MRDYCWFEKSLWKYFVVSEWMWPFPIFRGGRGAKNIKNQKSQKGVIKSSTDSVMRELNILRFPSVKEEIKPSPSRRVKQKWYREETKIDKECDFVIVPSDVECVSDTESLDSDWSIGWLEPHGTEFSSHDDESRETDNNFAVLVPCYGCNYGGVKEDPKNNLLSNAEYFSDESKKYVENWISSLRNT